MRAPPALFIPNGSASQIKCHKTVHILPRCKELMVVCPMCNVRAHLPVEDVDDYLERTCSCGYDDGMVILHGSQP